MKKILFTMTLAMLLMLVSVPALADTTYFSEDFESYPAGVGYYPDTFTDTGSMPYIAQVIADGGSNVFYCYSEDVGAGGYGENAVYFTPHATETQLTLDFTFMSELDDDEVMLAFGVPFDYVIVVIHPDGSITNQAGTVEYAPAGSVNTATYFDVQVVMNLGAREADVTIDGTLYIDDESTINANDEGTLFYVGVTDNNPGNAAGPTAYIDNVVITGLYTALAVNPQTGDTASYMIYLYMALWLVIMAVGGLLIKRRRKTAK